VDDQQSAPGTVTEGFHLSGPQAQAFLAGSRGEALPAGIDRAEDVLRAYASGQDDRVKRPLEERASEPLEKGERHRSVLKKHPAPPSVWSRMVDMVIPRRATNASDLAQQTALVRTGLRIASRRPGGSLAVVVLVGPFADAGWARWYETDPLLNVLGDPILSMAYGAVMVVLTIGAAVAMAQWPRTNSGGQDLVRKEHAAERS